MTNAQRADMLVLRNPISPQPQKSDDILTLENRIDATRAKSHAFSYERLEAGLRSGRFGGVACDNAAATTLVSVLRLRCWPVNYRAFAGAIPHYPDSFGLNEIRTVLQILGYASHLDKVRGANLTALPVGSFVTTKDDRFLFVRDDPNDGPCLMDPHSGKVEKLHLSRLYDCVVTAEHTHQQGQIKNKNSWIAKVLARFGPENRIILLLTFLSNTLIILASLSVGFIFDQVIPAKAYDTLFGLLLGVGLLLIADLRLRKVKSAIIAHVSGRLEFIVSSTLYQKLITFRLEMLTATSVSEQMNRLKQFELVRDFYCGPIVAVLFELPFVVLLLGVILLISPPIALLLLAVVITYLAIGFSIYPKITRASHDMAGLRAECLRLQEETISQRDQIVQRGLGRVWAARLTPRMRELSSARNKLEQVWRTLNSLITVMSPLAIGGVIIVGATQVMAGNMSGGYLIVCMIVSTRLLSPVQQALVLAVRAPELANMFRQLDAMMQIPAGDPPKLQNTPDLGLTSTQAPDVTLDGLVLRYPRAVSPALRGINLHIEGGGLTCLTGPSGAGKSSLLRVIMGHYRPQNGMVLINDENIEQFNTQRKTDLIGYLGHRSLQIHGTIAQNLQLTRPEATQSELEAVCDEIGLLETISALPEGFQTRLDQQFRFRFPTSFRTKLAVAQLLLKRPKILLLDEPESGLSDVDEGRLMQAIKARAGQMSCLMVTHRPSLVRQADHALVLNAGEVKFFGPPSDPKNRNT